MQFFTNFSKNRRGEHISQLIYGVSITLIPRPVKLSQEKKTTDEYILGKGAKKKKKSSKNKKKISKLNLQTY